MQATGTGNSQRKPIQLGGALVTLVEPHPGHEVAYDRWYERDHFYAGCLIGGFCFAGARFVADAACKAVRFPPDSTVPPPGMGLDAGTFLAIYWILDGHFAEWTSWATDQVNWLHANDRMFAARDHVHTVMYVARTEIAGAGEGGDVPVELALDHRFPGLFLVLVDCADGVTPRAVSEWCAAHPVDGAGVGVTFTPVPLMEGAPSDVPRDVTPRVLLLAFTEREPVTHFSQVVGPFGDALADAGLGRVAFSSPFRAKRPGVDPDPATLR